jgi:hypothetical protein
MRRISFQAIALEHFIYHPGLYGRQDELTASKSLRLAQLWMIIDRPS